MLASSALLKARQHPSLITEDVLFRHTPPPPQKKKKKKRLSKTIKEKQKHTNPLSFGVHHVQEAVNFSAFKTKVSVCDLQLFLMEAVLLFVHHKGAESWLSYTTQLNLKDNSFTV